MIKLDPVVLERQRIGDELKKFRKQGNRSQQLIEMRSKLHHTTVCNIENGTRAFHFDSLIMYCAAMNIKICFEQMPEIKYYSTKK